MEQAANRPSQFGVEELSGLKPDAAKALSRQMLGASAMTMNKSAGIKLPTGTPKRLSSPAKKLNKRGGKGAAEDEGNEKKSLEARQIVLIGIMIVLGGYAVMQYI